MLSERKNHIYRQQVKIFACKMEKETIIKNLTWRHCCPEWFRLFFFVVVCVWDLWVCPVLSTKGWGSTLKMMPRDCCKEWTSSHWVVLNLFNTWFPGHGVVRVLYWVLIECLHFLMKYVNIQFYSVCDYAMAVACPPQQCSSFSTVWPMHSHSHGWWMPKKYYNLGVTTSRDAFQ